MKKTLFILISLALLVQVVSPILFVNRTKDIIRFQIQKDETTVWENIKGVRPLSFGVDHEWPRVRERHIYILETNEYIRLNANIGFYRIIVEGEKMDEHGLSLGYYRTVPLLFLNMYSLYFLPSEDESHPGMKLGMVIDKLD